MPACQSQAALTRRGEGSGSSIKSRYGLVDINIFLMFVN